MRKQITHFIQSFGPARLIILGFFLFLCAAAIFLKLDFAELLSSSLVRIGMNGVLVLAMVPAISSGIGPNFGVSLGILAGLVGALIAIELRLNGYVAFLGAILFSLPFAAIVGYGYGWLLNRVKGSEMMLATFVGFSAVSVMKIGWLLLPFIGWLGCYFNDNGVNPMHDEFFAPMSPEAPAILKVAMEEGPDVAVSLHSHGSAPAVLRPAYLPIEVQQKVRDLAVEHNTLLAERSLPHGGLFDAKPEDGEVPSPFNLTSALYHVSGAMAFTHECPHGISGEKMCDVTFDEILDIQLTLYEVMIRRALEAKR